MQKSHEGYSRDKSRRKVVLSHVCVSLGLASQPLDWLRMTRTFPITLSTVRVPDLDVRAALISRHDAKAFGIVLPAIEGGWTVVQHVEAGVEEHVWVMFGEKRRARGQINVRQLGGRESTRAENSHRPFVEMPS